MADGHSLNNRTMDATWMHSPMNVAPRWLGGRPHVPSERHPNGGSTSRWLFTSLRNAFVLVVQGECDQKRKRCLDRDGADLLGLGGPSEVPHGKPIVLFHLFRLTRPSPPRRAPRFPAALVVSPRRRKPSSYER